jgi:mono/diheme cytochrome c family protein
MKTWKRVAGITLAASAATAAVVAGLVVYIGLYDVSATSQHTAPVYHLLETSLRRSVKLRTTGAEVPSLDDAGRIANGFKLFRAHCVQCHGAPGVAPQPFALGLTPAPAALVGAAHEWPAADLHWMIRNGIKMSGMPAWQYRLTDDEMWDVVAFMKVLPTLSPATYEDWDRKHPPVAARKSEASAEPSPNGDVRLGDAGAGKKALQQYLCATCHVIPGVVGANRHVGPPLTGIATRQYIAGVLPNTPANMLRWLRDPTKVDPLSAMPDLGLTDQDARDIAAFLYTLRDAE